MAFVTTDDVKGRLGRPLTDGEDGIAESVIGTVTGLIIDCVGRDQAWADSLDPVPVALKGLIIEKVIGAISNPLNLAAQSETLGSYSGSQTFPRSGDVSVFLTPFEERIVSRAIYGTTTGSSLPTGMFDREIELVESGHEEISEPPNPND
jgi:hypothetical protein